MNQVDEKKKQLSNVDKQEICKLVKKQKILNLKNIIDKIHKLIVKKLKLNVNCHIKIGRITTFLKSNNE
jgi:hypothetical protein